MPSPEELRPWPELPYGAWWDGTPRSSMIAVVPVIRDRDFSFIMGGVRKAVGIRCGAISDNMKVSSQAARSIG